MNCVALSIGCPCGIGPEVSVAAAAKSSTPCVLVGDPAVIERAARLRRVPLSRLRGVGTRREIQTLRPGEVGYFPESATLSEVLLPGSPGKSAGRVQFEWITTAASLVRKGVASALVTGPVSKHAIATSGAPNTRSFRGHTEYLQTFFNARTAIMAFCSDRLTVSLVTTHLPIAKVPRSITREGVARSTVELVMLLRRLGNRAPSVAVASLNPHAGEGELLGREEARAILPGIELSRNRLSKARITASITGPIGAETAFRKALAKQFDGVVAMYHDQATIPSKLVSFGDAVNVTLGLPIVRTSVDHGTGYDIAWEGIADVSGMISAIELAGRLT